MRLLLVFFRKTLRVNNLGDIFLAAMRSKTSQVFAWLIVVILVIGLAGFGIQDVIRSSGNNYIAKFGDQKVSPEAYVRAIQQEINFLSTQLGSQISSMNDNANDGGGYDRCFGTTLGFRSYW